MSARKALALLCMSCSTGSAPGDSGPAHVLDASFTLDAAVIEWDTGSNDLRSVQLDVGDTVDAGQPACVPSCPEGSECIDERCVASCPCSRDQQCQYQTGHCLPFECSADRDCPPETICLLKRCVKATANCSGDNDCGEGQRCSRLRQCTDSECLTDSDCLDQQHCSNSVCRARLSLDPEIMFERVRLDALEAHQSPLPDQSPDRSISIEGEWGFGAALLDYDGDLDLDLFLGSQAPDRTSPVHACLYANESLPGQARFVPVEGHCTWRGTPIHGGFATDVNNDGVHELLLAGLRRLTLQWFAPEPRQVELMDLVPAEQRGEGCLVGSLVSLDFNYDGRIDLLVGCQNELNRFDPTSYRKLLFLQTPDHGFRVAPAEDWPLVLQSDANTLALGAVDIDHNGLQDLLASHDSVIRDVQIEVEAGGIYLRCEPGQGCDFEAAPLAPDESRFGAFMGSGMLDLNSIGKAVYFTDLGTNRLVPTDHLPRSSVAPVWQADLSMLDNVALFSWGVVVDDFNRDGRDDLFIGQGSVKGGRPHEYRTHFDALMLQGTNRFDLYSDEVGITPLTTEDSNNDTFVYATRAVLKSDWDYNGHLDLISTGLEGAPRVHREVPLASDHPPRCTLIPRSRYVPGFGTGYRVRFGDRETAWDSQGQIRSSTSPFIVTTTRRGELRFPSGQLVAFDCGDRVGPTVVVEPEWLTLRQTGTNLSILTPQGHPGGAISLWVEPSGRRLPAESLSEREHRMVLPHGTERVMIRFGQRWLPLWFSMEPTL